MSFSCGSINQNVGGNLGGRPTSYTIDGAHPAATLEVPFGYKTNEALPLLIVLHGRSSTPAAAKTLLRLDEAKNFGRGMLVCAPSSGLDGATRAWNALDCCFFGASPPDEIAFLSGLITAIMADYLVSYVIIAGHSNGGFLAHYMAASRPDLVNAIFTVAGSFPNTTGAGFNLGGRTVNVATYHGRSDIAVKYAGALGSDATDVPQQDYPSALQTLSIWATLNGTSGTLDNVGSPVDLNTEVASTETQIKEYGGNRPSAKNRVRHYDDSGGDHDPIFGSVTTTSTNLNWRNEVQRLFSEWVAAGV